MNLKNVTWEQYRILFMLQTRANESPKLWFRSERFYHTNQGWWSQTREGAVLGPFLSYAEAEDNFDLYIKEINQSENN